MQACSIWTKRSHTIAGALRGVENVTYILVVLSPLAKLLNEGVLTSRISIRRIGCERFGAWVLVPLQGRVPGRVLLSECFACFALGSGAACWVLVPLQGAASMCCCHSAVCVWLVPLQGATGGCCCQSAVRARKRNCVLPTYLLLSGAYAGIISKVFFQTMCPHSH